MKLSVALTMSLAALSLAGCSKKADMPASDNAASVNEVRLTPPVATPQTTPGQAFVDTAAASDAFEIESSKLAATHAMSAKVKRFAQEMIKAHTESSAKLKTAAAAASPAITLAPTLTAAQRQSLDALSAKSNADFDRLYIDAQRSGHQATLDTLKAYAANGDVPPLKAFATSLLPIVAAHLNMAKGL